MAAAPAAEQRRALALGRVVDAGMLGLALEYVSSRDMGASVLVGGPFARECGFDQLTSGESAARALVLRTSAAAPLSRTACHDRSRWLKRLHGHELQRACAALAASDGAHVDEEGRLISTLWERDLLRYKQRYDAALRTLDDEAIAGRSASAARRLRAWRHLAPPASVVNEDLRCPHGKLTAAAWRHRSVPAGAWAAVAAAFPRARALAAAERPCVACTAGATERRSARRARQEELATSAALAVLLGRAEVAPRALCPSENLEEGYHEPGMPPPPPRGRMGDAYLVDRGWLQKWRAYHNRGGGAASPGGGGDLPPPPPLTNAALRCGCGAGGVVVAPQLLQLLNLAASGAPPSPGAADPWGVAPADGAATAEIVDTAQWEALVSRWGASAPLRVCATRSAAPGHVAHAALEWSPPLCGACVRGATRVELTQDGTVVESHCDERSGWYRARYKPRGGTRWKWARRGGAEFYDDGVAARAAALAASGVKSG